MCLATPGRIVEVSAADPMFPIARVDFAGVVKPAQLVYVPEAQVGDYVIVQAGFAIRKVPAAEAEECLRYARELAAMGDAPERSTPVADPRPAHGAGVVGSSGPIHRSRDKPGAPRTEPYER